jgi:hypothetical protein
MDREVVLKVGNRRNQWDRRRKLNVVISGPLILGQHGSGRPALVDRLRAYANIEKVLAQENVFRVVKWRDQN